MAGSLFGVLQSPDPFLLGDWFLTHRGQDQLPHGWLSHLALTPWVSTTNSVLEVCLGVGDSEREQGSSLTYTQEAEDFRVSVTSFMTLGPSYNSSSGTFKPTPLLFSVCGDSRGQDGLQRIPRFKVGLLTSSDLDLR